MHNQKKDLFLKFKNSKNADDEFLYKSYKKELDKQLDNARKKYFQNLMDSRYNSTRMFGVILIKFADIKPVQEKRYKIYSNRPRPY